ncbi:MAG: 3',5'-cyclic-nucleotide phosphodiesterase [Rhodocyclaceae bacterium]
MDVSILGCSGGIGGADVRTTALRVDHDILIDCGTGVGALELSELAAIDHVFLTHAHMDHIALLPMLIDSASELRDKPLIVHAREETLQVLHAHIFNWRIWPDFTRIPSPQAPSLKFERIRVGQTVQLGERRITAMPATHAVPALGYRLAAAGGSLAFTGDTALSDELVAALNAMDDLRYLLVETAYADSQRELAMAARHLCPEQLASLLHALTVKPEVFVTHLKPAGEAGIVHDLAQHTDTVGLHILRTDQVFRL